MARNENLRNAKSSKKDEFYTQLDDIQKELEYYTDHFEGQVVYCNCDDPRVSQFFRYFSYSFEELGLKKLIATCYRSMDPNFFSKNDSNTAVYLEYEGAKGGKRMPSIKDIKVKKLKGDGDFSSDECIEMQEKANIVVTNPPFSLFRQYVAQMMGYNKKFLILGNNNAITYKDIFSLIKDNKMWLGVHNNKSVEFGVPKHYPLTGSNCREGDENQNYVVVPAITWYTNLAHDKRNEKLILYKEYNPKDYIKYENYNAIDVSNVKNIPKDYDGEIGVPITFLDKYNPKQFEIVGLGISSSGLEFGVKPYKPEHKKYRREVQKKGAADGDLYMIKDGEVSVPYARIIIRKKGG